MNAWIWVKFKTWFDFSKLRKNKKRRAIEVKLWNPKNLCKKIWKHWNWFAWNYTLSSYISIFSCYIFSLSREIKPRFEFNPPPTNMPTTNIIEKTKLFSHFSTINSTFNLFDGRWWSKTLRKSTNVKMRQYRVQGKTEHERNVQTVKWEYIKCRCKMRFG